MNIIDFLFYRKVDNVLASFQRTVARLRDIEARNDVRVSANVETIERLVETNERLSTESACASNVAKKLVVLAGFEE